MRTTMIHATSLSALLLALAPTAAQEPEPPASAPAAGAPVEAEAQVDQLPPGTDPAAAKLWDELLAAAFTAGLDAPGSTGIPEPVRAFDLDFEGRIYQNGQTNDFGGNYKFLRPGFVRTKLKKSGRVSLRGPGGDWVVFEDGRQVELVGIDYEVDVEELDRTVGVAQSFVALTDPRTLRIERLARLDAAPPSIPGSLSKHVGALDWLALDTYDFQLERQQRNAFSQVDPQPELHRLEIGLDRRTHLPALALVRRASEDPRSFASARLLLLEGFKRLGKSPHQVPHKVWTYGVEPGKVPAGFDLRNPTFELYVLGGSLQPELGPDDFRP